jgi:hypothetical protein
MVCLTIQFQEKVHIICSASSGNHCANPSRNRPANGSSSAGTRLAEPVQDSFPEVSSMVTCRPLPKSEQLPDFVSQNYMEAENV